MLRHRRDDKGSTLVSVVIVMLVLSLCALTLAAVVTQTSLTVSTTRANAQARAAADAGVAASLAAFQRDFGCGAGSMASTVTPVYNVTCAASGSQVTFTSTGHAKGSPDVVVKSVYQFVITEPDTEVDHMTFFGSATFTYETSALSSGLLRISIARGDFTCQNTVPADLVIQGNFKGNGNCDVKGSVYAGGTISTGNQGDRIEKDAATASSSKSTYQGSVGGDFLAAGDVELGWGGMQAVGRDLIAGGNVTLYSNKVGRNVSVPSSKMLTASWQTTVNLPAGTNPQVGGTISRPGSVTVPTPPTFDVWKDYALNMADWAGYSYKKLTSAECDTFNTWVGTGWTGLYLYTTPTVIDATGCSGGLTSNNGSAKTSLINTNLVIVANSITLSNTLTLKPGSGTNPRMWFIVPDTNDNNNPDSSPSCGGDRSITLNHLYLTVPTLLYTPGCINVSGGGTFTGSMYSGAFSYGGSIAMYGEKVPFPGTTGGAGSGGDGATIALTLVSQRDVP